MRTERTALYRLYDKNDRLLYIGIAYDPVQRMHQHSGQKPWWPAVEKISVGWLDTRPEAEGAERNAIRAEKPQHNISHVQRPRIAPAHRSRELARIRHEVQEQNRQYEAMRAERRNQYEIYPHDHVHDLLVRAGVLRRAKSYEEIFGEIREAIESLPPAEFRELAERYGVEIEQSP